MEWRRDNDTEIQPSGGDQVKVGDLVKMSGTTPDWNGRTGIITKFSDRMWWILLTCGRLIATDRKSDMEVINESR